MATVPKVKTRTGRGASGRQASPRTNADHVQLASSASGNSHGGSPHSASRGALEREKDKEKRKRSTLLWIALFLAAALLHAYAAVQVYQYLTATCSADVEVPTQDTALVQTETASVEAVLPPPALSEQSRASAPRFMVYRIIGNNMPPLQCPSQLLWNTQYALWFEGDLPGAQKRWVVNKIVNGTERALILQSLMEAGFRQRDILMRWFNATQVALSPQESWLNVVTQQNEARNVAIEDGIRSGATWIIPLDGNHFITQEAWKVIQASAQKAEEHGLKHFKIPVHRLYKEQDPSWVHAEAKFVDIKKHAPVMIESQLAFHRDATERFKHGMVYGIQNKLEALERICHKGTSNGTAQEGGSAQGCWCDDLGQEGQPHPSSERIAADCGYTLRLWFYPCGGVDPMKVFKNGMYRKKLRSDSRRQMAAWIKREVIKARKQSYANEELRRQQMVSSG